MTVGGCSRDTTMACVGKDDDTDGGGLKRDEMADVFGGAVEDEGTTRFSSSYWM